MYVGKQLATCNFSGHICTSIPLPVGIVGDTAAKGSQVRTEHSSNAPSLAPTDPYESC